MAEVQFNYTGRIKLQPQEVVASYRIDSDLQYLALEYDLERYRLRSSCYVVLEVEAVGTTDIRRFQLGDLGGGVRSTSLSFQKLRNPELIRLRFKVVELTEFGLPMIRAELDGIYPSDESENSSSRSFLKIVKDDDLDVSWQLRFDEDVPVLYLSGKHDLFHQLRGVSKEFNPLILPEVVRQVFEWLTSSDIDFDDELLGQWIDFYEELGCPGGLIQDSRTSLDEEAIDQLMAIGRELSEEFCKRSGLMNSLSSSLESAVVRD